MMVVESYGTSKMSGKDSCVPKKGKWAMRRFFTLIAVCATTLIVSSNAFGAEPATQQAAVRTVTYKLTDRQTTKDEKNQVVVDAIASADVVVQQTDAGLLVRIQPGARVNIAVGAASVKDVAIPAATVFLVRDSSDAKQIQTVEGLSEEDGDLLRWSMMNPAPSVQLRDLSAWEWSPKWNLNGNETGLPSKFVMERFPTDIEIFGNEDDAGADPAEDVEKTKESVRGATRLADALMKGSFYLDVAPDSLSWSGVATIEVSTFDEEIVVSSVSTDLFMGPVGKETGSTRRVTRIIESRIGNQPLISRPADNPAPVEPTYIATAYHGVSAFTLIRGVNLDALDRAAVAQWTFVLAVDRALTTEGMGASGGLLNALQKYQPNTPRPKPLFPNRWLKWALIGGGAAAVVGGGFAMKDTIAGTPDRVKYLTDALPAKDPAVRMSWQKVNNMDLVVRDNVGNAATATAPTAIPGATHSGNVGTVGTEEVYWSGAASVQNAPFTVIVYNNGAVPCPASVTYLSGTQQQTINVPDVQPGQSVTLTQTFNP
jgi:hypothetical protein